jgi:hypothetical protein
MPASRRDPLDGIDRLVVDGSNLLHQLVRGGGGPPAAIVGRLRGVIPGTVRILLVFDGPIDQGGGVGRVAQGMTVRYAGRRTADATILEDVEAAGMEDPSSPGRTLVVTDDNALRRILGRAGARSIGTAWLLGRFDRAVLSSPSTGNRRAPKPMPPTGDAADASSRDGEAPTRRWRPGRGATTKVGNPRRAPRRTRGRP